MSARRLVVGVHAVLSRRAQGGEGEVDDLLASAEPAHVDRSAAVHALGGEVG